MDGGSSRYDLEGGMQWRKMAPVGMCVSMKGRQRGKVCMNMESMYERGVFLVC